MAEVAELTRLCNEIKSLRCACQPGVQDLGALLAEGARSPAFTQLVACLCDEVSTCCKGTLELEEKVHPTSGPDDAQAFVMELAGFLKALGCPHAVLHSTGDRLSTREHNLLLLNYLVGEVQCGRIHLSEHTGQNGVDKGGTGAKAQIAESATAATLREMCQNLALSRPPDNISEKQLFEKLKAKVSEHISSLGPTAVGMPLFSGTLTEKHWRMVEKTADELNSEYTVRAELLLKRVDVTVQSFAWSDRVKRMEEQLVAIYRPRRQQLVAMCRLTVADLLAARQSVLHVEKAACMSVLSGTKTKLQRLLIKGRVPDRGGRTDEMQAPPPEMPSWQQRQAPPGGGFGAGRGGRGGGGGPRGGRHQSPRGARHGGGGGGYQQQQPVYQQQQPVYQQPYQQQQASYVQHDNRMGNLNPQYGQYNAAAGAAQWGQPPVGVQGYNQGGNYLVSGGNQQYMSAQYVDPYSQGQGNYNDFAAGYNQQFNEGYQQRGGRSFHRGGGGRRGGRY